MTPKPALVLGLHPTSRGFGWIVFAGPDAPVDWGAAEMSGDKNARILMRIEALLTTYKPRVLVLESPAKGPTKGRSSRVKRLFNAIVKRAKAIQIHVYTRDQIQQSFAGAQTREEIAAAVANRVSVLRDRWKGPRKIWIGEQHEMGLFCAAACVLTYYTQLQNPA